MDNRTAKQIRRYCIQTTTDTYSDHVLSRFVCMQQAGRATLDDFERIGGHKLRLLVARRLQGKYSR